MRVRVALTLDVDPYAWSEYYGVHNSDVREVVHLYVREHVEDALAASAHAHGGHLAMTSGYWTGTAVEDQFWAARAKRRGHDA